MSATVTQTRPTWVRFNFDIRGLLIVGGFRTVDRSEISYLMSSGHS